MYQSSPPTVKDKCLLPPQYQFLQQIITKDFKKLFNASPKPSFIFTLGTCLCSQLVSAKINISDNQALQIFASCHNNLNSAIPPPKVVSGKHRYIPPVHPKRCRNCVTCIHHFNDDIYFRSTITKEQFRIRFAYTCHSTNIIYLITCRKCRKQYVGKSSNRLRDRIYGHRTSKKDIYLCNHFNTTSHISKCK